MIGDFPVGEDGTVTVPNTQLDEGYYIITEIQAPEGYILDSTPHEVYLRPGKTSYIFAMRYLLLSKWLLIGFVRPSVGFPRP